MTYRIIDRDNGCFGLAEPGGDLVRTTEGSVFMTGDHSQAMAARDFLNDVPGTGSHQLKSMFGKRSRRGGL